MLFPSVPTFGYCHLRPLEYVVFKLYLLKKNIIQPSTID